MALSPKQLAFVEEYALDHNAARAARAAGYSAGSAKVTGCRLLTNPNVAEAIQAREEESARRLDIDRERVLREIQSAIELARAQADPRAMIAGLRELAKMLGYYSPERTKVEISTSSVELGIRIREMRDEELLALADQTESDRRP